MFSDLPKYPTHSYVPVPERPGPPEAPLNGVVSQFHIFSFKKYIKLKLLFALTIISFETFQNMAWIKGSNFAYKKAFHNFHAFEYNFLAFL